MVDLLVLFLASNKAIHLRLDVVLIAWHLSLNTLFDFEFPRGSVSLGEVIQSHSRYIAGALQLTEN